MKKFLALLCAVLLLGIPVHAVEVDAPSAILMEKATGEILYAKDEHARLEPASVTKVISHHTPCHRRRRALLIIIPQLGSPCTPMPRAP